MAESAIIPSGMPSPIGHALAGSAIASLASASADAGARARDQYLMLACVALAVAPDLDLLVPASHRSFTHSIGAVALVTIISLAVTGKVNRRIALACIAAYASHLLMDWMAFDSTPPRGIRLLWPFSDDWYISGWDLFRGTARRDIWTATSMRINLFAVAQEVAIMAPVAWLAWLVRVKTLARFSTKPAGRHHPPQ